MAHGGVYTALAGRNIDGREDEGACANVVEEPWDVKKREGLLAAARKQLRRHRNSRRAGEVRAKDNRPAGQGSQPVKAQYVVVLRATKPQPWGYLPRITGQLPEIADVVRTTP